jgi:hypothetical protein
MRVLIVLAVAFLLAVVFADVARTQLVMPVEGHLGRQCNLDSQCDAPLVCSPAGRCVQACETVRDCPHGQYCVQGRPQDDYRVCAPRSAIAQDWFPALERNTDRPGSDLVGFPLDRADPIACHSECANDPRCRAWTYVEPGRQGALPRCYLKNPVPDPRPNRHTGSGVIRGPSGAYAVGGMAREAGPD